MPVASQARVVPEETDGGGRQGGLRSDLRRFTRERILNAALTSFQEIGFKETTVERIVDLAGTTAPTFYRHFNGKDGLLAPLQEHLATRVFECLARLTPEDIASPEKLVRWVDDYMAMWNEVHRLCKAFWDASSMEESLDRETFARMLDTGDTITRLFPQASPAEQDERRLRLGMIVPMIDRFAYLVTVAPDEAVRIRLKRTFAHMVWVSVLGPITA